jgi:hypothetical protein
MYLKKEVFLLVILLVLPIVNSGTDDFSCGNVLFGSCDGTLMCGNGENLIVNNNIHINVGDRYLFFGKENCDKNLIIESNIFDLTLTDKRSVVEFDGFDFKGEINLPCDKNYLSEVSLDIDFFNGDCYCNSCINNCEYPILIGEHMNAKQRGDFEEMNLIKEKLRNCCITHYDEIMCKNF